MNFVFSLSKVAARNYHLPAFSLSSKTSHFFPSEPKNYYLPAFSLSSKTHQIFSTNSLSSTSVLTNNERSFISLLQACAKGKNLSRGKQIHSLVLIHGFQKIPSITTGLINMYSKCDCLNEACLVFDQTQDRNVFAYNAIMAGLSAHEFFSETIEAYTELWKSGLIPDKFTFPCTLKAFSNSSELGRGRNVHAILIHLGLDSDVYIGSSLINFYLKFDLCDDARQVFDGMTHRDIVLWNAMVTGYAQIGRFDEALEVFELMEREGMEPSKFTLSGILSVFAATGDLDKGKEIHDCVRKLGFESDMVVCNALIDMYGKCKSMDDSRKLFEEMPERDLFSWNSIILGYVNAGKHEEALHMFDRMRAGDISPDSITLSTVLPSCSSLAAIMHGKEIHAYMIATGLKKDDVYANNAVMDMYAKCGSLDEARKVFKTMAHRDVVSWNIMIVGYGMNGNGEEALDLFRRMRSIGVRPDEVTLVGVLSACSRAGLMGPGMDHFSRMKVDYGVNPTIEHYSCVVDMLGRAGDLHGAHKLLLEMPLEPNPVVWRALLSACRVHNDVTLGQEVALKLLELEPSHCGTYVLLSNMYMAQGRHQDVSEVRRAMRRNGVAKTPGCSWIELRSGVHVFLMADRSHPECDRIYEELDVLVGMMRENGYVPKVNLELHDGEGEQIARLLESNG
ncbi:hypothetical protein AMTRI_Chr08g168630 [Amborella trichopoda]